MFAQLKKWFSTWRKWRAWPKCPACRCKKPAVSSCLVCRIGYLTVEPTSLGLKGYLIHPKPEVSVKWKKAQGDQDRSDFPPPPEVVQCWHDRAAMSPKELVATMSDGLKSRVGAYGVLVFPKEIVELL